MFNYLISIPKGEAQQNETIHDPGTKLKVKVIDLLKSTFTPSNGEVQYFVTAGNEKIAFETKGYKNHRKVLILQMISWYCLYLGLFEAQIHSTVPL